MGGCSAIALIAESAFAAAPTARAGVFMLGFLPLALRLSLSLLVPLEDGQTAIAVYDRTTACRSAACLATPTSPKRPGLSNRNFAGVADVVVARTAGLRPPH